MNKTFACILAILCLLAGTALAEVYKWKDASGKVHYTDNPKENPDAEQVTIQVNSYEHVTITESARPANPAQGNNSKQVIIYSTSWCGYCKKAKQYFQASNISYTDYDIEKDATAKQKYDQLGGRGVPVILVGQKRMNGFSVEGFLRIYN